jgi:LysM repeat protein
MLKFRAWYYQLEAIAKQYVATIKVPPGGYEALRKEVDRQTPGDVKINILPGPDGIPIIKGIVDQVADAVSQGAGWVADKVKSGLDMGTTPAKPSSAKKPDQETWYDSLIDQIKKTAGLTPEIYIVKSDDTFKNIAQIKRVSVRALLKANPQIKDPEAIYAGDELIIP